MAYLARQLITDALYLSSKVSRDFETVTGSDINDGLRRLNALLKKKSLEVSKIPYYAYYTITPVVGQEKYHIPGLLLLESATFNIGALRLSMDSMGRVDYFGSTRIDDIQSLPFTCRLERVVGGADFYIYFKPEAVYPIKITCKFAFSTVTYDTDLSLVMDEYYIDYLTYELASYMAQWYRINLDPGVASTLAEYQKNIRSLSPPDLSIQTYTAFSGTTGYNWGDVDFGRGWRPRGGG